MTYVNYLGFVFLLAYCGSVTYSLLLRRYAIFLLDFVLSNFQKLCKTFLFVVVVDLLGVHFCHKERLQPSYP